MDVAEYPVEVEAVYNTYKTKLNETKEQYKFSVQFMLSIMHAWMK